jgi:hypothetical protein
MLDKMNMAPWKVFVLVLCASLTAGAGGWLMAKRKYKTDHDLVVSQILGDHMVDMAIGQRILMYSETGNTEPLQSSAALLVRMHFVPTCQRVRQLPYGEQRKALSQRLVGLSNLYRSAHSFLGTVTTSNHLNFLD